MRMPTEQVLVNLALYDGVEDALQPDRGIWIDANGMIRAVGQVDDVLAEAGAAPVVDLGGEYVMPGLINMHTHFSLALPGPLGDTVHGSNLAELVLLHGRLGAAHPALRRDDRALRRRRAVRRLRPAPGDRGRRGRRPAHLHRRARALLHRRARPGRRRHLECDGADGFRRGVREPDQAPAPT